MGVLEQLSFDDFLVTMPRLNVSQLDSECAAGFKLLRAERQVSIPVCFITPFTFTITLLKTLPLNTLQAFKYLQLIDALLNVPVCVRFLARLHQIGNDLIRDKISPHLPRQNFRPDGLPEVSSKVSLR